MNVLPVAQARAHWRDASSPCNQLQAYRDDVWRHYELYRRAPDHGRRWRGRQLDRANRAMSWGRRTCHLCRLPVLWESGTVLRGRGHV